MAQGNGNHGIRDYVIIALILGVITYIEFYIVEHPLPWLSSAWVMFWLITLSIAKFFMVIWWFMHLKDDDKSYTGFFSSGMVIAMGTFIAFTFLMVAPGSLSYVRSEVAPDGRFVSGDKPGDYQLPGFGDDVRTAIDSDGYSRPMFEILASARPKDAAFVIDPPRAPDDAGTLRAEATPAPEDEADAPVADAEDAGEAGDEVDAVEATWDEALGADVFASNCASCHQGEGQGVPGAFPPLRSNVTDVAATDLGREYLIDVLLYGLQGPITVDGTDYDGLMPAWQHLDNDQIAAVLNHASHAWNNEDALPATFTPFAPDDVANQRGQGLGASDVLDLRARAHDSASAEGRPDDDVDPEPDEADTDEAEEPADADEPDVEEPEAPDATWDEALGADVYAGNCASCHQGEGQGVPGAFPPLRDNVTDFATTSEGRAYLGRVLLYGLQGPITVDGTDYAGMMPGMAYLDDDQIAAVLNHASHAWGNDDALPSDFAPFTSDHVADLRDEGLGAADVLDLRDEALAAPEADGDADEPADEPADDDADPGDAATTVTWDEARGADVFGANCTACHQPEGQGLPGAFPPLRSNVTDIASVEGGRSYLIDVLLYGLQGPITVDGSEYAGNMPGWQQLDDGEIADALNHLLHAWGNDDALPSGFVPYVPDDIADRRDEGRSPQEVHAVREGLDLP
ncbi:MAG: c-type cytochrome [Trueperaceae bacterium]